MTYPSNEPEHVPGEDLLNFVEQLERSEEEMRGLRKDRSVLYAKAKGHGYDTRILKKIVALRKRDADDVAEEESLMALYKGMLGMN